MLLRQPATTSDDKPARTDRCRECTSVLTGTRLSHPYLVLTKRSGPSGDNTYRCLICSTELRNNSNHLGCGWALTLVTN